MITITDVLKFRESIGDNWKGLLIQANMDFNLIYPVGSIYMSTDSTDPSLLFGGTWEQIKDTFLLAAGTTYAAGSTGGEATHTLTVDEMPSHGHSLQYYNSSGALSFGYNFGNKGALSGSDEQSSSGIAKAGGGQAHNNMPPYLAVYVWKRLTLAPSLPYPTNVLGDMAEVSTAFSIPAPGTSVSYNMVGITDEYELIKWNFSSSPENVPPADLTCDIYNGYFTITNNSGTTTETIKPLFIKSKKVAITAR